LSFLLNYQDSSNDDNQSDTEEQTRRGTSRQEQTRADKSRQEQTELGHDQTDSNDNQGNDDWTASFSNDVLVTPL
jgi:hypothetical protein